MIKKIFCLVILGAVMFLAGCGSSGGDSEDGGYNGGYNECLSCGETISWTSYGPYVFNDAGSDTTAWGLVDNCGWDVHSGHAGGYGDTLQVASGATRVCPPETDDPYETDIVEDYCDTAAYIHFLPFRGTGNTVNETVDEDDPDISGLSNYGHSVWYHFEADRDGYMTVSTGGSSYDTIVAAFRGNCAELEQIAYDDDSGTGLTSEIIFQILAGETYYLLVGSYGAGSGGDLILNATYRECMPEEDGVVLVWAYQSFKGFRVRAGWTGSTEEGIRIGSTLQEFLSTYSYFNEQNNGIYLYERDGVRVRATFDQNEMLEELMVGYYFRN